MHSRFKGDKIEEGKGVVWSERWPFLDQCLKMMGKKNNWTLSCMKRVCQL